MPAAHPTTIISADTETTSLVRPYLRGGRRIWDLGIIRREPDGTENTLHAFVRLVDLGLLEMIPARVAMDITVPIGERLRAHLPPDVQEALDVGRFFERHPEVLEPSAPAPAVIPERQLAELLMSGWLAPGSDLRPPTLLGVVPSFEDLGIADLLYRHKWINSETPWHYHPADVAAILGGALRRPPQWNSEELSREVGVDPDSYPRHTAIGDAQWALDLYDAVYGTGPERRTNPAITHPDQLSLDDGDGTDAQTAPAAAEQPGEAR